MLIPRCRDWSFVQYRMSLSPDNLYDSQNHELLSWFDLHACLHHMHTNSVLLTLKWWARHWKQYWQSLPLGHHLWWGRLLVCGFWRFSNLQESIQTFRYISHKQILASFLRVFPPTVAELSLTFMVWLATMAKISCTNKYILNSVLFHHMQLFLKRIQMTFMNMLTEKSG